MSISVSFPAVRPTLSLNFLRTESLDLRVTFARNSIGTRFNSAGILEFVGNNQPRFDYDPITFAPKGLLIEEERTNLLTYSEQFNDAAWTKANASVTANNTIAPDGTTTADRLVEDTLNTGHSLAQNGTYAATTAYSASVFLKQSGRSWAYIQLATVPFGVTTRAWFDLANGQIGTQTNCTASITSVGNGWYRCAITATTTVGGVSSPAIAVHTALSDNNTSYLGDGTSGIFIWGAQLEAGSFATSYIPTVASQVTRAADAASVNTLSPWYNATEGTLYAQGEVAQVVLARRTLATIARSTSSAQDYSISISRSADSRREVGIANSTSQHNYAPPGTSTSTKGAIAYKENDSQGAFDGVTPATDTTVALPTLLTTLYIGNSDGSNSNLNGWIKHIVYYSVRLPGVQLQELTK